MSKKDLMAGVAECFRYSISPGNVAVAFGPYGVNWDVIEFDRDSSVTVTIIRRVQLLKKEDREVVL